MAPDNKKKCFNCHWLMLEKRIYLWKNKSKIKQKQQKATLNNKI